MATIQDLVNAENGQTFGITGPDQGQCTAVPHAWEQMLGLPIVYGNAKDTYDNADSALYDKTLNIEGDLSNFPLPGAIVVWSDKWGSGFGHTAVVVNADGNTMRVLEQNDGDGGITHIGEHNYQDVIGWFYPKVLADQTAPIPEPQPNPQGEVPMDAQQERDAYQIVLGRDPEGNVPDGRTGIQFIYDSKGELDIQRQAHLDQVATLGSQINSLIDANAALNAKVQSLQAASATATPQTTTAPQPQATDQPHSVAGDSPAVVPVVDPLSSPPVKVNHIVLSPAAVLAALQHDVSWLGTTRGLVALQVLGMGVGALLPAFGLPIPEWLATVLGLAAGTTIHTYKNPATPNKP